MSQLVCSISTITYNTSITNHSAVFTSRIALYFSNELKWQSSIFLSQNHLICSLPKKNFLALLRLTLSAKRFENLPANVFVLYEKNFAQNDDDIAFTCLEGKKHK